MNKFLIPVFTSVLALSTTACDKTREALGLKRVQANEFNVMDRQPLSVPPNYSLRPPLPNAPAKAEVVPADQAKKALLGNKTSNEKKSVAEKDLLAQTNADNVDHSVREKLAKEEPVMEESAPGEALVFWKDVEKKKTGEVIDPRAENLKHNGKEMGSS